METVSKHEFNKAMMRVDKRFNAVEQSIHDEVHGLAAMITKGFADIEKRLDVKDRVDTLEKKMTKVESALNVRL